MFLASGAGAELAGCRRAAASAEPTAVVFRWFESLVLEIGVRIRARNWRVALLDLLEVFQPLAALPARLQDKFRRCAVLRQLPRGSVLFDQGASARSIFAVVTGRVAVQHRGCNGDCRAVCFVTPGGLCCCVTALDGGPYPATGSTATRTTVACIPFDLFREMLQTQPGFADAAMRQIGRQLRQSQCAGTPTGDARARIASKILAAVAQFGSDVPLTRREIAQMAGTTVETAIRQTRKFEEAGWISLRRGHVCVLDRQALGAVAGSDDSTLQAGLK